jgi:hypothetical protein
MKVVQSLDMIIPSSLFFVSVGPAEHYSLENFGGPWHTIATKTHTFEKKTNGTFDNVRRMLFMTRVDLSVRIQPG